MIDKTHAAAMQSIMSQIRRFESQVKEPAKSEMSPLDGATPSLTPTSKTGFGDVPLTDVMLAMQKSSIAFEATLQIRNKVMRAYEEIKNMPV